MRPISHVTKLYLLLGAFVLSLFYGYLGGKVKLSVINADEPVAPASADEGSIMMAQVYLDSARTLGRQREYEEGLVLCKEAIRIFEEHLGENDSLTLRACLSRAEFHRYLYQLDTAEVILLRAKERSYEQLDSINGIASDALSILGVVNLLRQSFDSARAYMNESLEMEQVLKGSDSEDVAILWNNIGANAFYAGQFEEAVQAYTKSIQIRKKAAVPDTALIAGGYYSIGGTWHRLGRYDKAIENYNIALDLLEIQSEAAPTDLSSVLMNMGVTFAEQGKYAKALPMVEQALKIQEEHYPPTHLSVLDTRFNLGYIFGEMGNNAKSTEIYREGIRLMDQAGYYDHPLYGQYHNNLSNSWLFLGEVQQSYYSAQEAVRVNEKSLGTGHRQTLRAKGNLAIRLHHLGEEKEAMDTIERAIAVLYENYDSLTADAGKLQNDKGFLLYQNGQHAAALICFREALRVYRHIFGPVHVEVHNVLNNIALSLYGQGNTKEAFEVYYQALEALDAQQPGYEQKVFNARCNLGKAHLQAGRPDSALYWLEKACELNQYDLRSLPTDFGSFKFSHRLLTPLRIYAAYQAGYPDQKDTLSAQLKVYKTIAALSNYLQVNSYTSGTQLKYARENKNYFENAIRLLLERGNPGDLEQALQWAVQHQARQLSGHLFRAAGGLKRGGVPDSLDDRLNRLSTTIGFLEQKELQGEITGASSGYQDSLQRELFNLREQKALLLDKVKDAYNSSYQSRYRVPMPSMQGIKDSCLLSEQDVLLNYFTGDSSLFVFCISKDTSYAVEVGGKDSLLMQAEVYLDLLKQESGPNDDFKAQAFHLYHQLIAPVEPILSLNANLIIIPDGFLWHIPFEGLLSGTPEPGSDWRRFPFLLKDYSVSYAPSVTALGHLLSREEPDVYHKGVLAFAPEFSRYASGDNMASRMADGELDDLAFTKVEAKKVVSMLGGKLVKGQEATVSSFKESAPYWRLLHLSTHSQANPEKGDLGFAAFSPEPGDSSRQSWLYANDLYQMQIHADQVVLSGCETGLGELKESEGVISLGRGFLYAGAGSVVSSLWPVSDQATAYFMELYYESLKSGASKAEALRQAKLGMLMSPYKEPVYWSAFTLVGDPQPLPFHSAWSPFWVWVLLSVIVGIIVWRGAPHIRQVMRAMQQPK
jgi:CHAT domain-containing protein/Tfp pilus assembly protein PilF